MNPTPSTDWEAVFPMPGFLVTDGSEKDVRRRGACDRCHAKKVRCSGTPCERCVQHRVACDNTRKPRRSDFLHPHLVPMLAVGPPRNDLVDVFFAGSCVRWPLLSEDAFRKTVCGQPQLLMLAIYAHADRSLHGHKHPQTFFLRAHSLVAATATAPTFQNIVAVHLLSLFAAANLSNLAVFCKPKITKTLKWQSNSSTTALPRYQPTLSP